MNGGTRTSANAAATSTESINTADCHNPQVRGKAMAGCSLPATIRKASASHCWKEWDTSPPEDREDPGGSARRQTQAHPSGHPAVPCWCRLLTGEMAPEWPG